MRKSKASKGPSAAPTLPGNPVVPPCTDRPGPATKTLFVPEAKDINLNPQLLNIYFEKIHHTEQPCAHAKRAEKVVLYLYSSSLYSGQDPSAK